MGTEELIRLFGADPSQFNSWRISSLSAFSSVWLTFAALILICAFFLSLVAISDLKSIKRKIILLTLRFFALVLVLGILFEPAITLERRQAVKSRVAVLLDASQSMSAPSGKEQAKSRFDASRELLKNELSTINDLNKDKEVELRLFGSTARVMTFPELFDVNLKPVAEKSEIARNITEALQSDSENLLSGIVVISDGIDSERKNTDPPPKILLDLIKERDLPVYTVDASGIDDLQNVYISAIYVDDFAYIRNTSSVTAEVSSHNYSGTVVVTLSDEERELANVSVDVSDGKPARAELKFIPQKVGPFAYSIKVSPIPGESDLKDNERNFIVKVIRDKIRLLHISGTVTWDMHFLRNYFRNRPDIDLVSFYILRTAEDLTFIPTSELALIPFPTDELFSEQLHTFDVLVLQNFDYGPYEMGRHLDNIKKFVEEYGGGLIVMGGDRGLSGGGYANTPVEDILPLELAYSPELDQAPFFPRISANAPSHPLLSGLERMGISLEGQKSLVELPPISGCDRSVRLKNGATPILEHPLLKDDNNNPLPVIATRDAALGRVVAINSDSLWRYWFGDETKEGNPRVYSKLFENILRFITRDPETQAIRILSDSTTPRAKAPVKIMVQKHLEPSTNQPPSRVNLKIKNLKTGAVQVHSIELSPGGSGEASVSLDEEGVYEATEESGKAARLLLTAKPSSDELSDLIPRPEYLREISKASKGGKFFALKDASFSSMTFPERYHARLVAEKHFRLWNNYIVIIILSFIAGTEWFLRRRWGYL